MIEIIKNISRKIGLISLIIALFSVFSYLITYGFLYGYYFGGEIDNSYSNFEFFRRFVPFHTNTMTFTYLMISFFVTLIIYIQKIWVEGGMNNKFLALMLLVIFHVIMTIFFTKEINLTNIKNLGAIWIFPLYSILIILLIVQGARTPFKALSGILFGFFIMIILSITFNQLGISEDWTLIFGYISVFVFGLILSYVPFNKYLNFIFVFPYLFFIVGIILAICSNYLQPAWKITIIIAFPILCSIKISTSKSKFFREIFKERDYLNISNDDTANKKVNHFISEILNPKTPKGALAFLVLLLLWVYVMTPRLSTSTAKIIRSFTPVSEFQFDLISVKDLDGKKKIIKGIIVAEQDSVIYISNENWELVQVKTSNYFVEREKNE